MTSETSTTTWETLVEQYRERAARDDARIEELRQRTEQWHNTADMLKRQRDMAEQERDAWKVRAMESEQQRQALQAERDALLKNARRVCEWRYTTRTDAVLWEETLAKTESKNGELQFALDHWIGVADVLKQQRDQAEKERDEWKRKYLDEAGAHDKTRRAWGEKAADMTRNAMRDGSEFGSLLSERDALRAERDALHAAWGVQP
jgi:hypothetical protein